MAESDFPHLNLLFRERGDAKLEGGGSPHPAEVRNRAHRAEHSNFLKQKFGHFSTSAKEIKAAREEAGLPKIEGGSAFVLQIPDENDGTIEFLAEKLGFEIVAEYAEGFLIVASDDLDLQDVIDLANDFANSVRGSGGLASILHIDEDPHSLSRIERILDEDLIQRWPFPDDLVLTLDVSIEVAAFGEPAKPRLGPKPKADTVARKGQEYSEERNRYLVAWDEKRIERENELEAFVDYYDGEIFAITDDSHVVDFPDSFSARIQMSGKGFKDLIANYPNLFEATAPDIVQIPIQEKQSDALAPDTFELLPPPDGSPTICVIDSGIQEGHKWLESAVESNLSRCFIPGKPADEVGDYVHGGGHGTRVAGACLYPGEVPKAGPHQPLFSILNARVLDETNGMLTRIFPAVVLNEIVGHYKTVRGTRIFQHSIGGHTPCRLSRMSVWASAIDLLSYEKDVLFLQAAGNLHDWGATPNLGMLNYITQGNHYPDYLYEAACRVANPAQSLQALTVGSVSKEFYKDADRESLSPAENPSSFSRSGFGLWNSIKPEVVEFGGDDVIDGGNPPALTNPAEVCPELIRSTQYGGPAIGRDTVGTSFSAPKVAHIAGYLSAKLPEHGTLLYRALIVNSARRPTWAENASVAARPRIARSIGYGVPDLSRASENAESRVTLITEGIYEIKAKEGLIFGVPIPDVLRKPGEDYQVRIDVTLSYAAEPRRTRKSRRGYLGVWLDWKASRKNEAFDAFRARALKDQDAAEGVDDGNFRWTLGNKQEKDGETDGVSRRNGTVQKDWVVVHSYELPDIFGIVVRGHEGWDRRNSEATARFALVVSFEALGAEVTVYEPIRAAVQAEVETAAEVEIEVVQ